MYKPLKIEKFYCRMPVESPYLSLFNYLHIILTTDCENRQVINITPTYLIQAITQTKKSAFCDA